MAHLYSSSRPLTIIVGLVTALSSCNAQVPTKPFRDPAPPKVRELAPVDAKKPTAYSGLTFHRAPKPLHKDAKTEDWPAFLGPRCDSRSHETHLLRDWPAEGPALVWSMTRGEGYASPAIAAGRVVFTHRIGNEVHVDCLAAETGKRFWRFTYPSQYSGVYIRNSGPRSTPLIANNRVYVHGLQGSLHCLELATGRTVWERDLAKELGTEDDFFGVVSSPILHGNRLILQLGAKNGPTVAAFDKNTGRMVWGAGDKWGASCCSPVIGNVHGRPRVFVLTGGESRPPVGGLLVLDPDSGKLDFEFPFRSKLYASVTSTTPVIGDNWIYMTSAYGVGSALLSLDAGGGFDVKWKNRRIGIQFSNALLDRGQIYVIKGTSDRAGAVVVLDPATGKEISNTDLDWDESVEFEGKQREISMSIGEGSLLAADGDFLCLGDNGHLLWLQAKPKGVAVLKRAWLFRANESWTPLALSRGLLYVCQNNDERFGGGAATAKPARLLCFDLRGSGQ